MTCSLDETGVQASTRLMPKVCVEMQFKDVKDAVTTKVLDAEVAKSLCAQCPDAGYKSCFLLISRAGPGSKLAIKGTTPNCTVVVPTREAVGEFLGGMKVLEENFD